MLKVNTDQISVDEFAKKYGFVFDGCCGSYVMNLYGVAKIAIPKGKTDFVVTILPSEEGEEITYGGIDNFIFDMVKNGDVVKEVE